MGFAPSGRVDLAALDAALASPSQHSGLCRACRRQTIWAWSKTSASSRRDAMPVHSWSCSVPSRWPWACSLRLASWAPISSAAKASAWRFRHRWAARCGAVRGAGRLRAADAGTSDRRDRRSRRSSRLRADFGHPRAAHSTRESDVEHLHQSGPDRARLHHPPIAARAQRLL